ncbi:MAG: hypothetical protein WCC66_01025 [Rhizobiaceae bacterium]
MSPQDKKSAIAAAIILVVFAAIFWMMPKIVLGLGGISPWLGGLAALAFMLSFFILFWIKSRWSGRK